MTQDNNSLKSSKRTFTKPPAAKSLPPVEKDTDPLSYGSGTEKEEAKSTGTPVEIAVKEVTSEPVQADVTADEPGQLTGIVIEDDKEIEVMSDHPDSVEQPHPTQEQLLATEGDYIPKSETEAEETHKTITEVMEVLESGDLLNKLEAVSNFQEYDNVDQLPDEGEEGVSYMVDNGERVLERAGSTYIEVNVGE